LSRRVRGNSLREKLAAYGSLATLAKTSADGKLLARGGKVTAFDAGISKRAVIVEFPSFEPTVGAYESNDAHQRALPALGDGVERAVRVVLVDN
jgi:uncharacterized protein (DUF1330 family)